MAFDKVYVSAMSTSFLGAVFMSISLSTPYWLGNDGAGLDDKYDHGGLWSMCFRKWDPTYDDIAKTYDGCYYVFEKELDTIRHYLTPGWFTGVQVLCSLCTFSLLLLGLFQFLHFMRFIGMGMTMRIGSAISSFLIGIFLCIAMALYGVRSSDSLWMPHPERNYLSWSFVFAVVATFLSVIAGMLFVVAALSHRYERRFAGSDEFKMNGRY